MRQILYLIILTIAPVLLVDCTGSGEPSVFSPDVRDSSSFARIMGEADSLYSMMQFRESYDLYLSLLDNEEVKTDADKRMCVLNALCSVSELSGHQIEQNEWLRQLIDLSTQSNNDYYHSLALVEMGQNVFYEGDRELGIRYVNEAVNLMAKTNRADTDHLMYNHLIMLARMYGEMKDYDNALKINQRNLQLTTEGTRWGSAPNQQLINRRMVFAKIAALLAKMGQFQRADSAYVAWKAIHYEGNHTRDYFIVDYMKHRGRYQEAVPIYKTLIQRIRLQGDTLGEMMNTAKWGLAEVYRKMGNCEQAAKLYEQVLEIQDTLRVRKAVKTAQELAAIYHDHEQNQIIMKQQTDNNRQRYLLNSVLGVLIGVLILVFVIIRKNRIISSKNLSLANQINEAMIYREKYIQEELKNTVSPSDITDISTLSEEQLFRYINDIIVRERLFLNKNFDRQTIMDRFNLSKERVGAAFSKGSQYAKLTDYMQELRLEYSTFLMSTHPDKSVSQIAIDCGFSSYAYYGKCFRHRFGMTPTEFRKSALQNQ